MLAGSATAQAALPFRPIKAEYSKALNRIVMIAAPPNQFHVYDRATVNYSTAAAGAYVRFGTSHLIKSVAIAM